MGIDFMMYARKFTKIEFERKKKCLDLSDRWEPVRFQPRVTEVNRNDLLV